MFARSIVQVGAASVLLVLAFAPQRAGAQFLPEFGAAVFDDPLNIDNKYFPLVPGTIYTFAGEEFDSDDPSADPEPIEIKIFVTNQTKEIGGVQTRVVRELETVGGLLVEDTTDFFAQDNDGNVWYFEEETADIEYDDEGNEIGRDTSGSWQHGVNGAQATHIMPANPQVGDPDFFVEFAPPDVLDVGQVLSTTESISIPLGDFSDVLKLNIIDVPEPEEFEHKYYVQGIGRALVESDFLDGETPLNRLPLVDVTIIPLPPAMAQGLVGLALALGGSGVLQRRRADVWKEHD